MILFLTYIFIFKLCFFSFLLFSFLFLSFLFFSFLFFSYLFYSFLFFSFQFHFSDIETIDSSTEEKENLTESDSPDIGFALDPNGQVCSVSTARIDNILLFILHFYSYFCEIFFIHIWFSFLFYFYSLGFWSKFSREQRRRKNYF